MSDATQAVDYRVFVDGLFNRSLDPSKNFAHAVLGIVTEIHELFCSEDDVNAAEEYGDLLFYYEAMSLEACSVLGCSKAAFDGEVSARVDELGSEMAAELADVVGTFVPVAKLDYFTVIHHHLNDLLDHAKRWVGYGKQPNLIEAQAIALAAIGFIAGSGVFNLPSVEDARRINVKKLFKRYQGATFSAEKALNRDLQGERDVLEAASVG